MCKKARRSQIKDFTGISSSFEEPRQAEIEVDSAKNSIDECIELMISRIEGCGVFHRELCERSV